jgi:ribosomal protein S18 acetylase RimI-like enzyme
MKRIDVAVLSDLGCVRELNTLLKISLNNIDMKEFYWNTNPYIEAAIKENRCFAIKNDSMIMGAMIMESRNPDHQNSDTFLAIGTLSVRPGFRRNGIGIQLVDHAKAKAQKDNKRLVVESFLEFRQLSFYKRLGFKEALQRSYYGHPYHVLFLDSQDI